MVTLTLESTLRTRCMGMVCINSRMVIDTRVHGMRGKGEDWGCTLLGMVRYKQGIGMLEYCRHRAPKIQGRVLLLLWATLRSCMQYRYNSRSPHSSVHVLLVGVTLCSWFWFGILFSSQKCRAGFVKVSKWSIIFDMRSMIQDVCCIWCMIYMVWMPYYIMYDMIWK